MTAPSRAPSQSAGLGQTVIDIVRYATEQPELFNRISDEIRRKVAEDSAFQTSDTYGELLRDRYRALNERHVIEEGMLIIWKEGMKNKSRPAYGEPCIVIQVMQEPEFDMSFRSSSAYFKEPLDLQIGVLDDDRELQMYYVDSRRFMPLREVSEDGLLGPAQQFETPEQHNQAPDI